MPSIKIRDELFILLYARAKREGKKIEFVINEIMTSALWNEPGLLFKGKYYKVEQDLFNSIKPLEVEE
jgi:hypothetical protein